MNFFSRSSFLTIFILTLHAHKCWASDNLYSFGCGFQPNNYYYEEDESPDYMYGVISNATKLNPEELTDLTNAIGSIIHSLMIDSEYNSIDTLMRFWNALKMEKYNNKLEDSEEDYYNYMTAYRPRPVEYMGYIRWLGYVLQRIVFMYPKFKDSIYFVIACAKTTRAEALGLSVKPTLPSGLKQNAVAGALKFEVDNQIGYVLIVVDPDDGFISHAVVMDNSADYVAGGNMKFYRVRSSIAHLIYSEKTENNCFIYFMEDAYCAIVKAIKAELFMSRRAIVKRGKDGEILLSVYFDMFPEGDRPYEVTIEGKNVTTSVTPFYTFHSKKHGAGFDKKLDEIVHMFNTTVKEFRRKIAFAPLFRSDIFINTYSRLANEINGIPKKPSESTSKDESSSTRNINLQSQTGEKRRKF